MEIISPIHGKITYELDEVIRFEKSIPGFEDIYSFIIKDVDEEGTFKLLQSIDDVDIGFILVSPFYVEKEYEIKLTDELIDRLDIKDSSEVVLYAIVTLSSQTENITVNLKAPLIINIKEKKGEQFIVDKENYKIKHPLMKG